MKAAALVAAALLVAACSSNGIKDPVEIDHMSFDMQVGANDNRPARLELVRVDEERLVRELVGIETVDWFGPAGEAFRSANPDAVYDTWELVPGQTTGPFEVEADGDLAAILFCDTREPPPPLRLVRDGRVDVRVGADGCAVEGEGRAERFRDRLRRRRLVTVTFSTSADAGGHSPVRVELVRSPDPDVVEELARLEPRNWFADAAEEFRRAHRHVLFDHWELVPDATFGPFRFAVNRNGEGILFCAGADRPLRIPWRKQIAVHIDGAGCELGHAPATQDDSGDESLWQSLTRRLWAMRLW